VASEQHDLPLFPLHAVLFPGMALPLRVFEERYKQMVGRCLERNEGFGVVLIREGNEVGEPATPFDIGTLARIASVERFPDGRMNLVTVGTRRFRCIEHLAERPYRVARVAWLDDEQPPDADCAQLAREVRAGVEEYLRVAYALAEQPRRAIDFPDDVVALSFQVGAVLQIAAAERQRLLEVTATDARLRQELAYLRRETRMLQMLLSRRDSGNAGGFSRN
jgi:Lon protease-like protein